jgi:hypothetical protein
MNSREEQKVAGSQIFQKIPHTSLFRIDYSYGRKILAYHVSSMHSRSKSPASISSAWCHDEFSLLILFFFPRNVDASRLLITTEEAI